jgi:hypothetical protein
VIDVKFLHIGHHKCGSTFFQYEIIPKIEGLTNLPGKKNGKSNTELRHATISLITKNDLYFDFNKTVRPFYDVEFNCISNEGFVGFGSLEASACHHIKHTAERLRRLFGETKILFIIRNQKRLLPSLYIDDVEYGYAPSFENWIERRAIHSQLDWFKFSGIIATYNEIFGAENVKTVLYEDFFSRDAIEDILTEFGIGKNGLENVNFDLRINESMAAPTLAMTRGINQLVGTRANWAEGFGYKYWVGYGRVASDKISRALGFDRPKLDFDAYGARLVEHYHEDNCRTSELIGIDLQSRGYP